MCIRDRSMFQQAQNTRREADRERLFISSYAYAVSEENADGGQSVTAPTCGASGIMPAILYYCYKQLHIEKKDLIKALAIGGLFGNVVKTNGTISGADGGCQAEVGTACAMAAATMEMCIRDRIRFVYLKDLFMKLSNISVKSLVKTMSVV